MHNYSTIFQQLSALVPRWEFERAVAAFGGNRYVKTFKCWSQFITNLYAQISGKDSLREIETALKTQKSKWYHLGLSNIARSTLAHANQRRPSGICESLFYRFLARCRDLTPRHKFKFKNPLFALDASVIDLCLSLFPWARFRRKKGAVKLHCLLDYRGEIPGFLLVTEGRRHECKVAKEAPLPLSSDSIICFDKGYLDFEWLKSLDARKIFFVTRTKSNAAYQIIGQQESKTAKGVLADQTIQLTGVVSAFKYPGKLRLITFYDREEKRTYRFLTNNFKLAASTIAEIYRARWKIEIFFKWIKQNLKIKTFLGTSKNAVLTQIWTAMIYYLLLAYLKYQTKYAYSLLEFTRMIQATLFERIQLIDLLSLRTFEGLKIKPQLNQTLLF